MAEAPAEAGADDAGAAPFILSPAETADPELTDWLSSGPFVESMEIDNVETTLEEAQIALDAGRLIEPADDNALQRFLAVLSQDSENQAAQNGLAAISDQLLTEVSALVAARQLDEAARLLPALNQIPGDDEEAERLTARVRTLRRAQQLAVIVAQNLAADRLIEPPQQNALERLGQLQQLDPDHPQLGSLQMGLEQGLVDRAIVAAQANDFVSADQWLQRAMQLPERSTAVSLGAEQVTQLRAVESERLAQASRRAIRAYDFAGAVELIDEFDRLAGEPDRTERLRDMLRLGQLYGNHRPGDVISDALPGAGAAPPLVVVPTGTFQMGSPPNERGHASSEEPQFGVNFEQGFALGKTEVTVGQFGRFVAATGYVTEAEDLGYSYRYHESTGRMARARKVTWRDNFQGRKASDDDPVTHVSWRDAKAYAEWLAEQTGQPYRLPTEAEFEYALRAGSETRFWWGESSPGSVVENLTGSEDRSRHRNEWATAFDDYGDGYWGPAPVASFQPNPFALYDMAGNVSEWVEDCWHDSYVRAPTDGSAWVNPGCQRRVARGGYWGGSPAKNRSAYRAGYPPQQRGGSIGFRVARDLLPTPVRLLAQEE